MSRYDWENLVRQLAIHNMEIGPADAASFHPDPEFARPGTGSGNSS